MDTTKRLIQAEHYRQMDIEQARRRLRLAMENQREAQSRADYAQSIVITAIKQLAKLEEKASV